MPAPSALRGRRLAPSGSLRPSAGRGRCVPRPPGLFRGTPQTGVGGSRRPACGDRAGGSLLQARAGRAGHFAEWRWAAAGVDARPSPAGVTRRCHMHSEERGALWLKGAALSTTHTAGTPRSSRAAAVRTDTGRPGPRGSRSDVWSPRGPQLRYVHGRVPTACRHGDTKHAEQRDAIRGPAVRVPDRAGPSATRPEPALVPPASGVGTSCSRANGLVAPVSRPDRTATRHACPPPLRAAARCPVRGRWRPRGRASRPGPAAGSQGGRGEICAVTVPGRPAAPAGRSGGGHGGPGLQNTSHDSKSTSIYRQVSAYNPN